MSDHNHNRRPDFHDMIQQLTSTHTNRETFTGENGRWITDHDTHLDRFLVRSTWPGSHTTQAPSLVHQLLGAMPAGSGEMTGATPASRPAARIEAIDTIMLIDHEASAWVRRLGEDDPGDRLDPHTLQPIPGSGTIRCLLRISGLHLQTKHCHRGSGKRDDNGRWCCPRHHLEHDVRDWWHQARIITGWDSPAYRPFNTCPVCEHRGGLRINLVMHAGFCVECRSIWTPDEIGLLAEHIRSENADTDDVA